MARVNEPALPLVVVLAGPNGAGKSTLAERLLQEAWAVNEFVNADVIARGLSGFRPERAAIAAGRVMIERTRSLASERLSFAFETTLASRTFAPWLERLHAAGYRSHLAFLSLPTAELAVARVAERVRRGGHHVPEDVIRRRFVRGLRNFFDLYDPIVGSWQMYDNATLSGPRPIAARAAEHGAVVYDEAAWARLREVVE